jgi:hypothetical protein
MHACTFSNISEDIPTFDFKALISSSSLIYSFRRPTIFFLRFQFQLKENVQSETLEKEELERERLEREKLAMEVFDNLQLRLHTILWFELHGL